MATTTYPIETICQLLGISPRRVQLLVNEGVIPRADRNKYQLVPCVQGYIKYLRERAINTDVGGEEGMHKMRLLKARADIAEAEAERQAGSLVSTDEIAKQFAAAVTRFRTRMLEIPTTAAPMVAVDGDIESCHDTIETLIHEALSELAATDVQVDDPVGNADEGNVPVGSTSAEDDDFAMGGSLPEAVL